MTIFFFDIVDRGCRIRDDAGQEFKNAIEAAREAICSLPGIALFNQIEQERRSEHVRLAVEVRGSEDPGTILYKAELNIDGQWCRGGKRQLLSPSSFQEGHRDDHGPS